MLREASTQSKDPAFACAVTNADRHSHDAQERVQDYNTKAIAIH